MAPLHLGNTFDVIAVFTDLVDPLSAFGRAGVDAQLAWNSDADSPALLLVSPDPANLRRLRMWDGSWAGDGGSAGGRT
jgi:hypothetical protein